MPKTKSEKKKVGRSRKSTKFAKKAIKSVKQVSKSVKQHRSHRSKKHSSKRAPKRQQKGGNLKVFHDPIKFSSMPAPSTSGSFSHFVDNIFGLVESSVDAVVDTTNLVLEAIRIPMDLGKAYEGSGNPTPYNVKDF